MEGFRPGLILPVRNLSPGSSLMHDRGMTERHRVHNRGCNSIFFYSAESKFGDFDNKNQNNDYGQNQLSNCELRPVISRTSCLGKTSKIEARRKRSSSIEEKKIKKKKARRRN